MSRRKRIFLAVCLVAVASAIYIYKEYNRPNENILTGKSAFSVRATELVNDFETNDSAASKKYVGKIISIAGLIKNINQDERGYYTLNLGDTSSMSSVRCSVDSTYTDHVTALKPGMSVKIKGNCTGYNEDDLLGLDVIVNRCVIERH